MRFARTMLFGSLLAVFTLPISGNAQEETDDQPNPPVESTEAAENASEEQAPDEGPAGSAASREFEKLFGEWKAVLKELREIKVNYQAATREQRPALQEQWNATVAKGQELLPQLVDTGLAAFREAPNADVQLSRFLITVADDFLKADRYEEALKLSQDLIDAKCDEPRLYDIAGMAAFSTDQFEVAKQNLLQAQNAGATSAQSADILGILDEYAEFWAEEQKLREAEASSNLPRVKLLTNKGDIEIELFEDQAPETVGNFVNLVEQGFYDGITFHRVLPGFMAQGGCPVGTGEGGPGYEIYDELGDNGRKHFRGSISMANTGQPNSGGSQFFLTFRPTPHLNGKHTVFGRIVSGIEVLEKLQRRNPEDASPPIADKIEKAEVVRKRDHAYVPHKVE